MLKKIFFIFSLFYALCYGEDITITQKIYIDETSQLTFQDIQNKKSDFKVFDGKRTSFGLTPKTAWVYLSFENKSDTEQTRVIEFPFPPLDHIEIFEVVNKKIVKNIATGDLLPFTSREIKTANYAFDIKVHKNETSEYYFKIKTSGALNVGFHIYSHAQYHEHDMTGNFLIGGYYGAVVLMVMYNFILFIMIKEKIYFEYVVFHIFYLLSQMSLNGHTFQFLWPKTPEINTYFTPVAMTITSMFGIIFASSFLNIKSLFPKIYRFSNYLVWFYLFIIYLTISNKYDISIKIATLAVFVVIMLLFIVSLYTLFKYRTSESKFFVSAWTFLLIGVLVAEAQNVGLINMSAYAQYAPQLGAFMELALLSFALAFRYDNVVQKLVRSESELRQLNIVLENKVIDRTMEIEKKNKKLEIEVLNKNTLMKELFHRVKNNLQIISSLLTLQSNKIEDEHYKTIFNESTQRIKTMSLIHEKLYKSDILDEVYMDEYVSGIAEDLRQTYQNLDLKFHIDCNRIRMDLERAIPMGLIINELMINANKYAFNGIKDKKITIFMYTHKEDYVLDFYDNGVGLQGNDISKGFGLKLLKSLAVFQLKGKIKYFEDNGLHYIISFPQRLEN